MSYVVFLRCTMQSSSEVLGISSCAWISNSIVLLIRTDQVGLNMERIRRNNYNSVSPISAEL